MDIFVIGSLNMDLVVNVDQFPKGGETVRGGDLITIPGGKGANQAAAAALLGASVSMLGRVGKDLYGYSLLENLKKSGVDVTEIVLDPSKQTGSAMIQINVQGENSIVISPGANSNVTDNDVRKIKSKLAEAKILLLQLELPTQTVLTAIKMAHLFGVRVILNPAPAAELPQEIFPMIDVLIPNEREASLLSGIDTYDIASAYKAAEHLRLQGAKCVIITLGSQGSVLAVNDEIRHIPAVEVKVIDSTAAGDAFIGGLAFAILNSYSIEKSVRYASVAGALAVTKKGAQTSLPTFNEVFQMYKSHFGNEP